MECPHITGLEFYPNTKLNLHIHIFFVRKNDSRHIEVKYKGVRIHSLYVPAGGDIPDVKVNEKFRHKLKFLEEMKKFFDNEDNNIIGGDLNIAPFEEDVWSHNQLRNVVSHTNIERKKLLDILSSGNFVDPFRELLSFSENLFTWWSYRSPNFLINNRGRRLDHIWVKKNNPLKFMKVKILKEYRELKKPSDHVPIFLEIKI